ncbi:MAG: DMT family transporter [Candidatus Marinimicrobia bacterium]|nr:DMT family transporter [Candidatus Neomarinimicrobiota bacterium]MCF7829447.1 DMT family transporter [Candidatus Neomarinimicrobiota bacterium]MCF7880933.1 DMT family transporter [Candidatus Neomarinimicrobiota bacterium]
MTWLFLTLISAFCWSSADALSKWISEDISDFTNVWVRFVWSTPFFLLLWFGIEVPELDSGFWTAMAFLVPLEVLTWTLYLRAIRMSPLSLTIPFLGLTPVFLLVVPWILLGETVSLIGGVGVAVIALGIYLLNVHKTDKGLLEPFKAIRHEPGSLLMILVAGLFSLSSTFGKMAITHSSPLFFAGIYYPLNALLLAPYALSRKHVRNNAFAHPKRALLIGIAFAGMALAHFYAISIAKVAYMIAVKRTSLVFSTLFGFFFFKERNIRDRLLGGVIIIVGVFLIAMG